MGYLKIVTAILIWSSLGIFIRKIDLPNQCIIFYTSTIAGAFQFFLLLSTGLLKQTRQNSRDSKKALYLLLAPLCFVANTMLFYYAFRHTTIANAVLTHYTAPVFVAILSPLLLNEKINATTWSAIAVSSAGLWLILGSSGSTGSGPVIDREYLGILAGALSGMAYAFLIIFIRKIASLYSSLFITFIQNGIVVLILLPFVLNIPLPAETLPYLLVMGVVHSTIAPLLYVQGFRSVKAHEAAILGYFEPVGAILLALLFFREVPGTSALIGGVCILLSGYLIVRRKTA